MQFKSYSPKRKKLGLFYFISVVIITIFLAVTWRDRGNIIPYDYHNICFITFVLIVLVSGSILFYKGLSNKEYRRYKVLMVIYETCYMMLMIAIFLYCLVFTFIAYYPAPLQKSISYYEIVERGNKPLGRSSSACKPGIKIKDPNSSDSYLLCLTYKPDQVHENKVVIISK